MKNVTKGILLAVGAIITCALITLGIYYSSESKNASDSADLIGETTSIGETNKKKYDNSTVSGLDVIKTINKYAKDSNVGIRVIHFGGNVDLYGEVGVTYCKDLEDEKSGKETEIVAVTGLVYNDQLSPTSDSYIKSGNTFYSTIRRNSEGVITLITFRQERADADLEDYGHTRPTYKVSSPTPDNPIVNDNTSSTNKPNKPSEGTTSTPGTSGTTESSGNGHSYTVNHYKMKLDGKTYSLAEIDKLSTSESSVTPNTKTYTGFTAPKKQTVSVAADGSTVVDYYYTRNQYWLNLNIQLDGKLITSGITQVKANLTVDGVEYASKFNDLMVRLYYDSSYRIYDITTTSGFTYRGCIENSKYSGLTGNINEHYFNPGVKYQGAEVVTVVLRVTSNKYTIEYDANGGNGTMDPSTHEYGVAKALSANKYERTGYNFIGWSTTKSGKVRYKDKEVVKNLSIGSSDKVILYAVWEAKSIEYTVNYYKQDLDNDKNYTLEKSEKINGHTDETVRPEIINYTGFTSPKQQELKLVYGKTNVIDYRYTRNSYTVNVSTTKGINSVTGNGTYKYEQPVTVTADLIQGYEWTGWTGMSDLSKQTETFNMPGKNLKLRATAVPINYTITYELSGGSAKDNPSSYTVETPTFSLNEPTRTGYTFIGWVGSNGDNPEKIVTIQQGSLGNKTYKAVWNPIEYNISYDLAGGSLDKDNPNTYTIETETFTLNNPTKRGYTFIGWTGSNGDTPQTGVTVKKGSHGDKSYVANWKATVYKITYDLDGGVDAGNPSTYTIETPTFTLKAPTKRGYNFVGWTGSNGDTPEFDVTIKQDSIGDLNYKANWEPLQITINYLPNGGTGSMSSQVVKYDERVTIEGNQFKRTGYKFKGWSTDSTKDDGYGWTGWSGKWTYVNGQKGIKNATLNLYVIWEPIEYSISYSLDGGTVEGNPSTYTIESDDFTLKNPTKKGYTFTGWTGSNGDTPQTTVTVKKGTYGNLNYKANWSVIKYSITYDLDGGTAPSFKLSYTVDTADFTLVNPSKPGYKFIGWTGSNGDTPQVTVTIKKGTTGNLSYKANWEIIVYNITYNLNNGSVSGNPSTYTIETDTFTLKNPTRVGYIFAGWTGTGLDAASMSVSVNKGSTGDRSYTAKWTARDDTKYVVNHYQMNLKGEYTSKPFESETKKGVTDSSLAISTLTKTYTGFTFSVGKVNGAEVVSTTILPDGSRVIDLYYSRNLYYLDLNGVVNGTAQSHIRPAGKVDIYVNGECVSADTSDYYTQHYYGSTYEIKNVKPQTGYVYDGLGSGSAPISGTITGTKNVRLSFSYLSYTIKYDGNGSTGGSVSDQTVKYNDEVSISNNGFSKTGYAFKGWNTKSDGSGTDYASGQTVVSLVSIANGSITLYAQWGPNTDTKFTVHHYYMNANGGYPSDYEKETTGKGITDSVIDVSAYTESKEGFTYSHGEVNGKTVTTATILPDGSRVINLFYSRNKYRLTTVAGNGIATTSGTGDYYHGATVSIGATVKNGYTWKNWTGYTNQTSKSCKITMPMANATMTANATSNTYNISYNLNGGASNNNPDTYTPDTDNFTLNSPTKVGFKFMGWTGSNGDEPQLDVVVVKGTYGDLSYTANWIPATDTRYVINHYQMNENGQYTDDIVDTVAKSGTTNATVTLADYAKSYTGFTYDYGTVGGKTVATTTINADGSTVINLYYSRNKYKVTLVKGTGISAVTGDGSYYHGASVTINATVSNGYSWRRWTGYSTATDNEYTFTMPVKDVTYTANTTTNSYSISYNLDGGTISGNPTSYTIETEDFTLKNPTKTGYTFTGWTGSNGDTPQTTVTVKKGTYGKLTYTANWVANSDTKYTLLYYKMDKTGAYPDTPESVLKAGETESSIDIATVAGTIDGFTYKYATVNGNTVTTATILANGSLTIKVYYSRNKYIIDLNSYYKSTVNTNTSKFATFDIYIDGNLMRSGQTDYYTEHYYGTEYEFTNMKLKDGYKYVGVYKVSSTYKDLKGTIERYTTVVPQFECNTYTLKYDGNGASSGAIDSVTLDYDESITLAENSFVRPGYTFTGWNTAANVSGTSYKAGDVVSGLTATDKGTAILYAQWSSNENTKYVVNHYQMGLDGNYPSTPVNTEAKTGKSDSSLTLVSLIKSYTGFTYSYGNANGSTVTSTTILPDGSRVIDLYYSRNKYTVTLIKGTGISAVTGGGSYYYGASVTIDATVSPGYTWKSWSDGSTVKKYTINIPAGDVSYTATATANTYTITYDLDGGTVSGNPTTYTPDTASFTLKNPTKVGYTFTGWTGSNGTTPKTSVTVSSGTYGNLSYKANWSANTDTKYTVNIYQMGLDGQFTSSPTSTVIRAGTTGATLTLSDIAESYTGFTYSYGTVGDTTVTTATISADGSTVVNLYYNREKYWLDLNVVFDDEQIMSGNIYCTADLYINGVLETKGAKDVWVQYYYGSTYEFKNIICNTGYVCTGVLESRDPLKGTITNRTNSVNLIIEYENYNITYDLAGGSVSGNPSSYTIATDTFTLKTPTREGYTFTGWTGSNGSTPQTSVTITKGTYGNRSYTANWKGNTYLLNVNGRINGSDSEDILGYGTFNVYIDGTCVASGVSEYKQYVSYNSYYQIKDINATSNSKYCGVYSGDLSGYIGTSAITIALEFKRLYTVRFYGDGIISGVTNGASGTNAYNYYNIIDNRISVCATSDDGYGFIGGVYCSLQSGVTYSINYTLTGETNHEIFLCLNGEFGTYVRLTYSGQQFTVPTSGTYYLRLDVNKNGATTHFYDLDVHPLWNTVSVPYGTKLSNYYAIPGTRTASSQFIGFNDGTSVASKNSFYSYRKNPMLYYADSASDLYSAFGYDQTSLNSHYWNNGYYEGRVPTQYHGNTLVTSNLNLYAAYVYKP